MCQDVALGLNINFASIDGRECVKERVDCSAKVILVCYSEMFTLPMENRLLTQYNVIFWISGYQINETMCPAATHSLIMSSLTRPYNTNAIICTIVLKLRPMRLPLYWMRYHARTGSIFRPFTSTDRSLASNTCRLADTLNSAQVKPHAYLITPRRTVWRISTGLLRCISKSGNEM